MRWNDKNQLIRQDGHLIRQDSQLKVEPKKQPPNPLEPKFSDSPVIYQEVKQEKPLPFPFPPAIQEWSSEDLERFSREKSAPVFQQSKFNGWASRNGLTGI